MQKKGIEKEEDLSPEEKIVFDKYKRVLTGDVVTVELIKEFCKGQIALLEGKISTGNRPTDIELACLCVYLNMVKAIEAPEAERESLEKYLTQLIQQ